MIEVNIEIEIKTNSKDVFNFISNFENNPKWQNGMQSCKYTKQTENVIGTTYNQIAKFLGKEIITSFEVIEYEANRLIKATSTSGSFPITFTRWVEQQKSNTTVRAKIEGDSSGFFRLFSPIMKFMVNRSIKKDYRQLKKYFEEN